MKYIHFYCLIALMLVIGCQDEVEKLPSNPFQHGVASGDPLTDAIIIWTRVTGDSLGEAMVNWKMATDVDMKKVVQKGVISTNAEQDYTVKMDVKELNPNTSYYYQFDFGGYVSPVGRTVTAPTKNITNVKLAVVSCSNYEAGYYNAFARLAEKDGISAVLHLGDYIYEYEEGGYGDSTLDRKHLPKTELLTLADYRTRYAQYRSDADLQRVHQVHPFINIWDDHEIANNAHITGGQNHNEGEGSYLDRKAAAKKAFYEWLPIRDNDNHYRKFQFGEMATVMMLDERLEGRTPPVESSESPTFNDEDRAMLGKEQFDWLIGGLKSSITSWNIIGSQVIFSDWVIEPLGYGQRLNMDAWDGYPAEKKRLMTAFEENDLKELVFVSGDSHSSYAFEVPSNPAIYDARTSNGTIAVEFATPSITSSNPGTYKTEKEIKEVELAMKKANRHLKYVDLSHNGYIILDMFPTQMFAHYYYVDKVNAPSTNEEKAVTYIKRRASNQLIRGK
jgi:alkaline phosphatase D